MCIFKLKINKNTAWNKRQEIASIDTLTCWIKNPVLKEQTKNYFLWTINKAWKYLVLYNISNIILIVLPAAIIMTIELRDFISCWEQLVTVLSFLSAVLTSSAVALRLKSLWQLFRSTAEQLKSECLKCSTRVGEYDKSDDETREKKFSENIEELHSTALVSWKNAYSD